MIPRILAPLLGLLVATPAFAADYTVGAGSTLGFTSSFQGESFDGTFKTFEATIRYDPADLATASFDVSVDLASVVTGDADRDGALPDAEFFDVKKAPKAHFKTTAFRKEGAGVVADGTLTLKGVTKPVTLAVTFTPAGNGATLDVTTTLKRLEFNVGTGEYADTSTIADAVKVKGSLKLVAK
ncbi:YceI family protein [Dokdonella sp. MW10]|uniref:YceI family protein n=1 Tax=Dokdonella sp. MW10 TaxID=2992926 RepID=UPI003F7E33FE